MTVFTLSVSEYLLNANDSSAHLELEEKNEVQRLNYKIYVNILSKHQTFSINLCEIWMLSVIN